MSFIISIQSIEKFTLRECIISWIFLPLIIGYIIGIKIRKWII